MLGERWNGGWMKMNDPFIQMKINAMVKCY